MLFHSYNFLLLFLPVVLLIHGACIRWHYSQLCSWILLLASLVFAACAGPASFLVLLFSTLVTYALSQWLRSASRKKAVLVLGLVFQIGLLGIFKYLPLQHFFPLGISFYTFQQIAYLVDTYRGETAPCSLRDYCLFTSFFPKLVQGPIPTHRQLMPQLQECASERNNFDDLSSGLFLLAIGLSKKILVADQFSKIVDFGYGHLSSLNQFEAIMTILAYTLQIYFDFSGYCDMACGIARMLHIELPQNFNSPYKAKNISDFWKRWHRTLTHFLTTYIYIPLGGSRKGTVRTYLNILIVFLISGLWHGTGITFLIWGLLHGFASIFYRMSKRHYDRMPALLQWLLTFLFLNLTWVFFRAPNVHDALGMLHTALFAGGGFTINAELTETLLQPTFLSAASRLLTLPVVVVLCTSASLLTVLFAKNSHEKLQVFRPSCRSWLFTFVLLLLSLLSISGVSTFLYSNF